ncbi:MAG: hypothetical protein FWD86_03880, partial [Firmicutes bacterium]|nr:hypothetical protein [Bacillota bacterium]
MNEDKKLDNLNNESTVESQSDNQAAKQKRPKRGLFSASNLDQSDNLFGDNLPTQQAPNPIDFYPQSQNGFINQPPKKRGLF